MEPNKQRFNRAHISTRDFEKASEFIEAARCHPESGLEYEAFMISAIVCYARPFSGNERSASSPAASNLAVPLHSLEREDLELHERILAIRNKAVAHSEFEKYPVRQIPVAGSAGGFATTSTSFHIVSERLDLDAFVNIAKKMHALCVSTMHATASRV